MFHHDELDTANFLRWSMKTCKLTSSVRTWPPPSWRQIERETLHHECGRCCKIYWFVEWKILIVKKRGTKTWRTQNDAGECRPSQVTEYKQTDPVTDACTQRQRSFCLPKAAKQRFQATPREERTALTCAGAWWCAHNRPNVTGCYNVWVRNLTKLSTIKGLPFWLSPDFLGPRPRQNRTGLVLGTITFGVCLCLCLWVELPLGVTEGQVTQLCDSDLISSQKSVIFTFLWGQENSCIFCQVTFTHWNRHCWVTLWVDYTTWPPWPHFFVKISCGFFGHKLHWTNKHHWVTPG